MNRIINLPVCVVVFALPGCPACAEYEPVFRQVASAWAQRIPAFFVDSTAQPQAADFYGIQDLPTTLVLRYGAVIGYPEVGALDPPTVDAVFRMAASWV